MSWSKGDTKNAGDPCDDGRGCQDWSKLPCVGGQYKFVDKNPSNGCFGPVEFELPTAILKDHELHAKVKQTWEFENDKCITTNAFNNLTVDVHHVDCKETVSGSRESNFDQSFNIVRKC